MNRKTKISVPTSIKQRDKGDIWRRHVQRNTTPAKSIPGWSRSNAPLWSNVR